MTRRIDAAARAYVFLCVFGAVFCSGSAEVRAAGPHAESGEWEMTATSTNPMLPTPQSVTRKECLTDADLDPDSFMRDVESCSVKDLSTTSNTMSWALVCAAEGGQMTGKGRLETSAGGKKVAGSMTLSANFGGQAMNFTQEWSGRWVGPCP